MRKQPQNFFDHYVQKLSNLFLEKDAIVNFALVGACDGTNDNTIRDRYIPNYHWHGVFVEPFSMNFRDLNVFMEHHGLMNRTHLIQAGATSRCNSSTIKMKRPDYEEKVPFPPIPPPCFLSSIPHAEQIVPSLDEEADRSSGPLQQAGPTNDRRLGGRICG